MFSEKIKRKQKVYEICSNSKSVNSGEIYDGVTFADEAELGTTFFESQPITVHGLISEDELLVSAENQRYFFSLTDGWGTANNLLFALKHGFFIDFVYSVTQNEMEKMLTQPMKSKGCFSSLAEYGKREQIKKILSAMNGGCGV